MELIAITTSVCRAPNDCELIIANVIMSTNVMLTNISFVKCQFIGNRNIIYKGRQKRSNIKQLKGKHSFQISSYLT